MNKIATLAVLVAVLLPSAASAAMLNATPAQIMDVLVSEITLLSSQVSTNGIVAGASTDSESGLVIKINGANALQFRTATEFNVAKEICYLFAVGSLISGDNYTCSFNDKLTFDSEVDAV